MSDVRRCNPLFYNLAPANQNQTVGQVMETLLLVVQAVKITLERGAIPSVGVVEESLRDINHTNKQGASGSGSVTVVGSSAPIIRSIVDKAMLDQWRELHALTGLGDDLIHESEQSSTRNVRT